MLLLAVAKDVFPCAGASSGLIKWFDPLGMNGDVSIAIVRGFLHSGRRSIFSKFFVGQDLSWKFAGAFCDEDRAMPLQDWRITHSPLLAPTRRTSGARRLTRVFTRIPSRKGRVAALPNYAASVSSGDGIPWILTLNRYRDRSAPNGDKHNWDSRSDGDRTALTSCWESDDGIV